MPRQVIVGLLIFVLLLAAGCATTDPCTSDPKLSACRTQSAIADATIAAVNADQAAGERQAMMKATQDKIALEAQATQGAINNAATASAVVMAATAGARQVEAEATQAAVRNQATSQAVVAAATQNAIALKATQEAIRVSATQTALEGQIKIDQAQAQASAAGVREWLLIGTVLAVVIMLTISGLWYSRRLAQAAVHGVQVRAAFRVYGPHNNRAVLITPGPQGEKCVTAIDDLIGDHILTDGTQSALKLLDVPDREKLIAYIEQAKRRKAVEIAAVTGAWPELDGGAEPPQLAAPQTVKYPYLISTTSSTAAPLPAWLDEVDQRLLAGPNQ